MRMFARKDELEEAPLEEKTELVPVLDMPVLGFVPEQQVDVYILYICIYMYIYIYVCMCVCVCSCVPSIQ